MDRDSVKVNQERILTICERNGWNITNRGARTLAITFTKWEKENVLDWEEVMEANLGVSDWDECLEHFIETNELPTFKLRRCAKCGKPILSGYKAGNEYFCCGRHLVGHIKSKLNMILFGGIAQNDSEENLAGRFQSLTVDQCKWKDHYND